MDEAKSQVLFFSVSFSIIPPCALSTTGGFHSMFAVIRKDEPVTVLRTFSTKEAALIAAQLEKGKVDVTERGCIIAVAMDDGGYEDILF
jgi:hypothetical protein